ncbi:MAG TPA: patatin-like phospholipase family protein [Lautropia sp.]|nr:patatin-like phospholipase family protein [Lautropia sp.]
MVRGTSLGRPLLKIMGAAAAPSGAVTEAIAGWFRSLRPPAPRISLALQGGGAHGAFTWGVLDSLLEDSRVNFDGLSGSSAGAMNAVVLADGWMKGGRDGARQGLRDFWTGVGRQVPIGMVTHGEGDTTRLSPVSKLLASWAGHFSPSQLNPLDLNPLRDLIESQIDFAGLRLSSPFKLFIGATQANTGKLRVFREDELTSDMLLASACLPKIHHAVNIDGEHYWDGGYSANPAVFPLFYDCDSRDVLLVLLSPLRRENTPRTVEEIEIRIMELAFNSHFMREMRMFAEASDFSGAAFVSTGRLERRLQKMRFHMIDSTEVGLLKRTETQAIAHAPFLEFLYGQGKARAAAWLADHFQEVGRRSTLDIRKWFS